jgi:predicted HTH transcriptional regulator
MEPTTTTAAIATITNGLVQHLKANKAVTAFFDDFTEASKQWLRPFFLKADGTPKKVIDELQEMPENTTIQAKLQAVIENNLQDNPTAETLLLEIATNKARTTSEAIYGKTIENLDERFVKQFFALPRVKKELKYLKISTKTPIAEKLRALHLMTNGYVVKGTFFCLANHADFGTLRNIVGQANFGAFSTLDKTIIKKSQPLLGNLVRQYNTLLEYIKDELTPQIMVDIRTRSWDYSIPEIVLQELLANAFVHRSYEQELARTVTVELYPDRIVIENVGAFPPDIDPADLSTLKPNTKNIEIAAIFYLNQFIERQGSGIARVQKLLAERDMSPAIFEQKNGYVTVTVYKQKDIGTLRNEFSNAILQGNTDQAQTIATQLIGLAEKRLGNDNIETAIIYQEIARQYHERAKYMDALPLFQKAIPIYIHLFGNATDSTRTRFAFAYFINCLQTAEKTHSATELATYNNWLQTQHFE